MISRQSVRMWRSYAANAPRYWPKREAARSSAQGLIIVPRLVSPRTKVSGGPSRAQFAWTFWRLVPLPIQRPSDNFVDRPRSGRSSEWRILTARATRIPALPALPSLLILSETERAVRTSIAAPRTLRRYPIVAPPVVIAISADGHRRAAAYQTKPAQTKAGRGSVSTEISRLTGLSRRPLRPHMLIRKRGID
jgi:hypothetical protein